MSTPPSYDSPQGDPSREEPEWDPYRPPPPSGWELVWFWGRRLSFPIATAVALVGFAALLYFAPDFGPGNTGQHEAVEDVLEQESPMSENEPQAEGGGFGSGYATLNVGSVPEEATVVLDGDTIGTAPLRDHAIRSGVYHLRVTADGYFTADTVAVLREDDNLAFEPQLRERPELVSARDEQGQLAEPGATGASPTESPEPDLESGEQVEEAPDPEPAPASEPSAEEGATEETEPEAELEEAESEEEASEAFGTLTVRSTPSDATVEIDGEERGTTPLSLSDLRVGTYTVTLARPGYDTLTQDVDVSAGEERTFEAELTQRIGTLRVLVQPWGTIYIDGDVHERETDVWYETELPVGSYQVEARHPALGQRTQTVEVPPGDTEEVIIDLREE